MREQRGGGICLLYKKERVAELQCIVNNNMQHDGRECTVNEINSCKERRKNNMQATQRRRKQIEI